MNKDLAGITPYLIDDCSGLVGSGHIVARAIAAKIVALCRDYGGWAPLPPRYIIMRSPENEKVVRRFLGRFVKEGKLSYDSKAELLSVTYAFLENCYIN